MRVCFKYNVLDKKVVPRINNIITDLYKMLDDNILIPTDFKYQNLSSYLIDNYHNIINNYNDIIDHIDNLNKDLSNCLDEINDNLNKIDEIKE